MPFLSIFRKDRESPSPSTFSRARSRPSTASRETASPPPQLADISPQSDLSYVLPELEELPRIPTSPTTTTTESVKKRGLLTRRGGSALATPSPRHTSSQFTPRPMSDTLIDRAPPRTPTNINTNLRLDPDDDPLVPPPPRASVFAGFSYSEQDRPRAQSVPAETERPPRQLNPHQRLRDEDMKAKLKKDGSSTRTGLFGWRTKPKEAPSSIHTEDSSFSLKSFRHVGPPSPVVLPEESTASLVAPGSTADSPTTTSTARPVPGRSTPTTRERVNSTSSEGVMTAGLFRQAARRSSTNLVEEVAEPVRARMRDLEKRGPPTRSWAEESTVSSGSDRPPAGPRKSAPDTSSRKHPYENKPRKSMADVRSSLDDEPESPSPFAGRLGESGRTSPFATRSESGHVPRLDYSMYGARSDGGIRGGSRLAARAASPGSRSTVASPSSPTKSILASGAFTTSPAPMPTGLPSRPGPQGYTGPRATSPTKPRPSSPEKRVTPASPTKPRLSAPTPRPTRSPIRTTIPTKTNDGPSLKSSGTRMLRRQGSGSSQSSVHAQSALGHGRRPSTGAASARSVSVDVLARPKTPSGDVFVHSRQGSTDNLAQHTRRPSVDVLSHTRRPSGFEVISRPKSPGPAAAVEPRPVQTKTTDQLRQEAIEAMRNGAAPSRSGSSGTDSSRNGARRNVQTPMERAKSPGPSIRGRLDTATADTEATPRKNYVPPPRMSSLAAGLLDSDSDESPEEVESESEGLGFGKVNAGAMRGRHGKDTSPKTTTKGTTNETRPGMGNRSATHSRSNSDDQPGLTRERTITQRDAPPSLPKIGVSLFDGPVPNRTRASHSTSAISAAATARNSAALAEANRPASNARPAPSSNNRPAATSNVTVTRPRTKKHSRGSSFGAGSVSHARMAAIGTDTDEDESSEESSEDDAPLSSLAPAKRPGSAASTAASVRPAPRPSAPLPQTRATAPQSRTAPLISIPGVTAAPPRPPRINRVPGVGVTRNSSLRGSRSVEDLGRKPVTGRPGPRPFAASPPSSTGDSSSGKAPLTPRDGSEAGRDGSDEARRKERRRSEAKKSVELGNVINGPGPIGDDDEEDSMSMHHSQLGHAAMGMMGMGWNQSGFYPPGGAGPGFGGGGFPTSQSMPFLHPQMTGQPMPPMGFMPPPPPPGASEAYLQAHHQAMMIAKQTYLSAVAQQAMAAATEQWERSSNMGSSNMGGSVYGGSQMSMNMGMMGMPMMGMYAGSSYAASAYEGSVAGWGSASAYGGPSGPRSVYGGSGARSEFGGGMKTKSGPGQNRIRGKTQTGGSDSQQPRVPPSTWNTRRKAGL